jgi:hypothetical protein
VFAPAAQRSFLSAERRTLRLVILRAVAGSFRRAAQVGRWHARWRSDAGMVLEARLGRVVEPAHGPLASRRLVDRVRRSGARGIRSIRNVMNCTPGAMSSTRRLSNATRSETHSTQTLVSSTPRAMSSTPGVSNSTPSGTHSTRRLSSSTRSGMSSTQALASSTPSGINSTRRLVNSTPSGMSGTPRPVNCTPGRVQCRRRGVRARRVPVPRLPR